MHQPKYNHADYAECFIQPEILRKKITKACEILKPITGKFQGVAFRGASGTIPGPMIALRLKKSMILVRKGEKCHSTRIVEGDQAVKSYIIVDDQISSGKTIGEIVKEVQKFTKKRAKLLGVLLLGNDRRDSVRFLTRTGPGWESTIINAILDTYEDTHEDKQDDQEEFLIPQEIRGEDETL